MFPRSAGDRESMRFFQSSSQTPAPQLTPFASAAGDAGATILFNPPPGLPRPTAASIDAKRSEIARLAERLIHRA